MHLGVNCGLLALKSCTSTAGLPTMAVLISLPPRHSGRWPIMQVSLFLVNIWALGCALAPNFDAIIAFRILGGFSSAGGSVTLAYIADMFEPEHQGHAVAFVVLSSVGGSVLGPIVGEQHSCL